MNGYTDKQYVELFHLLFLAQLGRKVDKRFCALKGGCNLRFFFKSPRYSQDMDLDAREIPVHRLQDRVNAILASKPFAQILQVKGIAIEHINDDKQTQTVQRWKLGLVVPRVERPLPTKIEFSRRSMSEEAKFEAIDPAIVAMYELQPMMTNHYAKQVAYQQKVQALINRKELQARDVFELDLLLGSCCLIASWSLGLQRRNRPFGPGSVSVRAISELSLVAKRSLLPRDDLADSIGHVRRIAGKDTEVRYTSWYRLDSPCRPFVLLWVRVGGTPRGEDGGSREGPSGYLLSEPCQDETVSRLAGTGTPERFPCGKGTRNGSPDSVTPEEDFGAEPLGGGSAKGVGGVTCALRARYRLTNNAHGGVL